MESSVAIKEFWRAYCATRADPGTCLREPHDAWSFGDSPRMADELGQRVRDGTKSATAGLPWEDAFFGWAARAVGEKTVILNGAGRPLCVIETTAVVVLPFDAVDSAFAALEGEGFANAAEWRRAHWRYFSRRCRAIGREPSERMPVCCQQIRVVFPR